MPADAPRTLGVAISTYRRPAELRRCLAALAELGDLVHTVCVVDDDPGAAPAHRPAGLASEVRFVALVQPTNAGLPAALIRAFDALSACDEVLVLDDDTVVDRRLVEHLRAALAPGVAASTVSTEFNRRFAGPNGPTLFAWSPSVLRREALDRVGPPERRLFFGYDDWDLALRLRDAGWRIASIDHDIAQRSARTPWPERRYFAVRNATWLATRRPRHRALFGTVLLADLRAAAWALKTGVARREWRASLVEPTAAIVGGTHGLVGRLGPPPGWVMAGRERADDHRATHGVPPGPAGQARVGTVERHARRLVGTTRHSLARAAGRVFAEPRVPSSDSLRVLADLESFPPVTNAGSEWSMAETLRRLAERGHDVRVLVPPSARGASFGGIDVRVADRAAVGDAYEWADVVCSQLGAYNRAARRAARHRRPIVAFLRHGSFDPRSFWGRPDLLVHCAAWTAARHPWPGAAVVLHPPIDPEAYRTARGEHATLVNLSAWKGGDLLGPLARALPDHPFLGVRGGWGAQVVPEPMPPNLRIVANTPDAREVYAQTRVLLHPSTDEGYPRVVLEAAVSGIPTIAHPADGTRAALGDAAIYVDRDDVDGWVAAIRRLDDPDEYARWSQGARARFDVLDRASELDAFEAALRATVSRYSRRPGRDAGADERDGLENR